MRGNDEFYIGWEETAAPGIRSRVRCAALLLFALSAALGVGLALAQGSIGVSAFEWGNVKRFTGTLRSQPVPHLLVRRPAATEGQTPFSSYYLVNPFKFGLDPESIAQFDGKGVSLKGTLIYRGRQTMIEVVPKSIRLSESTGPGGKVESALLTLQVASPVSLGEQTLIGEIIDSKCYLGVMNPGLLAPHRACAIRCISGGIPPMLLVRRTNGPALHLLLVSRDGKQVNRQVLSLVAEPVEITGEVERQGDLLILRSDPATYRRR